MMNNVCDQRVENMQTTDKAILLVEDDTTISELLLEIISQETHYQVFAVPDGPPAFDLVKHIKPGLLILDYWLPTIHGIDLYDKLHTIEGLEQVPTIMLSVNAPLREMNLRHITYIRKPFDIFKLLEAISTMIKE
jgi:DNA-binding response OmpR family regulator